MACVHRITGGANVAWCSSVRLDRRVVFSVLTTSRVLCSAV